MSKYYPALTPEALAEALDPDAFTPAAKAMGGVMGLKMKRRRAYALQRAKGWVVVIDKVPAPGTERAS